MMDVFQSLIMVVNNFYGGSGMIYDLIWLQRMDKARITDWKVAYVFWTSIQADPTGFFKIVRPGRKCGLC